MILGGQNITYIEKENVPSQKFQIFSCSAHCALLGAGHFLVEKYSKSKYSYLDKRVVNFRIWYY